MNTTLASLHKMITEGLINPAKIASVETRLGALVDVQPRKVAGSYDVWIEGSNFVNMLAGYEPVFVEVQ